MTLPEAKKPPNTDISIDRSVDLDPQKITRDIAEKVPSMRSVPEADRVKAVEFVVKEVAMFSGPLPPPAVLNQYNMIVPGLADRIVSMAENSLKHNQDVQNQILSAEIEVSNRDHTYRSFGMKCGILVVIGMLLLVGWLAYLKQPWLAGLFAASSMSTIVWMFIRGQSNILSGQPAPPRSSEKPDKKTKKRR
jgi:uncharacterized membrane protein